MKDYFGQKLAVGDKVAFCRPQYRDLVTGTITGFTPKKVRVKYQVGWTTSEYLDDYLGEPSFFIKHPKQGDKDKEVV